LHFVDPLLYCFLHSSESKKTRIEILRRSVPFSARELRSKTRSCILGWCQYQNKTPLKLKSAKLLNRWKCEHVELSELCFFWTLWNYKWSNIRKLWNVVCDFASCLARRLHWMPLTCLRMPLSVLNGSIWCLANRLQLKRRLISYRHPFFFHEMVSYRSSWAENLTHRRHFARRVSFGPKNDETIKTYTK